MLKDIPPPMTIVEYYNTILEEWDKLLNSDEECDERVFQEFLEQHPSMVPGAFELFSQSGHYPFPLALISQPPLMGLGSKVPDFLWFATNSQYLHPIFIEIETPYKKWFTKEGHQHHQLTQALEQLAD